MSQLVIFDRCKLESSATIQILLFPVLMNALSIDLLELVRKIQMREIYKPLNLDNKRISYHVATCVFFPILFIGKRASRFQHLMYHHPSIF